ncbi:MAG TPA: hypothetical protein VFK30_13480, partial [Anaerolineae bacterium]|nr:hypothetical protein [Anaerolineae bacterium]
MKLVRAIVGICFAASAVLFTYLISSQPVQATGGVWYVASNGNDSNNCASPATPCATINGALNVPTFYPGDTVMVAGGIYTDNGSEVVTLNNNVRLLGGWDAGFSAQAGYSTIDGQNARRGITVYGLVNASIDHFIIQHSSADQGAGIYNNGLLTITYSTVQNNVASSG